MDTEDSGAALVPARVQNVEFYGDTITAAETDAGTVYVPLRPICENLGLSWSGQLERTRRDPVLAEALHAVRVTRTASASGVSDMLALPLDMLPGWLFGVNVARVKPELQERITLYRRECFKALWSYFSADMQQPAASSVPMSGAELAVENARALLHLAEQQVEFERRLTTMADYMRPFVRETQARLTSLELQLSAGAVVSPSQAAEIALAVKNVANALERKGKTATYAAVYSELYRRFRVSSYLSLPAARYEQVMSWLSGWYDEVQAGDPGAK